jgi:MFS family permease
MTEIRAGARPRPRAARRATANAFVIHAVITGSWAPRLPAIKTELALSDGELGSALAGMALGLLIGTRAAGRLADRFSSRSVIRLGLPAFCLVLVGPAVAWSGATLFASLLVMGLAAGALDVALNSQGVDVERGLDRPVMARLHGVWSVGLGIGAGTAALAAGVGLAPAPSFLIVGWLLAVVSVAATTHLMPASAAGSTEADERVPPWSLRLLLMGLIAFCALVGEGAAADWAAVYLAQHHGASPGLAAVSFLGFAVGMAAVRFISDPLQSRFGPAAVVRAATLAAAAGLAIGLGVDTPAALIAAFTLLGVGMGPVVPIVFAAAGHLSVIATGRLVSRVATMGYIGAVAGPVIIGWMGEAVGLRSALLLPALLALAIAVLAGPALSSAS